MHKIPTLLAALFLALPLGSSAEELDSLLARNTEAHGGAENWAGIRNVRYRLTIIEPSFEVEGSYVATREGSVRMDITADGKRVFSEGLHEGSAWRWSPDGGVEQQNEEAALGLLRGILMPGRFFLLQDLPSQGAELELVGEVNDRGQKQWQIRVSMDRGFSREYYLDDESGRIVRERDRRAIRAGADADKVTVETRKEDPDWVNGTLYYKVSKNLNADSGEWLAITRVNSVEHNIEIPAGFFLPE